MPASFKKSIARLDHDPFLLRIDLVLVGTSKEQVDLWWVLPKSSEWSCSNDSNLYSGQRVLFGIQEKESGSFTRQTDLNISFAGVRASTCPASNRFDCSQLTLFPLRLKEKVTRAAIPALAKVRPVMKT